VGRFERRKGIEELYAVLNELLPVKNFEFHFIGPIPESLQVASPRVKYWGLVKESASIQQILSECDVLVCPSHAEGMPTVILEAMASGLATIATDVGAVAEVVSSENGWLIPAGDSAALKRAISEAVDIAESDLREKQRKAMALISEKFTWERVIQRTITEIQMVVQKLPAKGS
jgi:glycosyltransferase involved in cell wall biosynthesis